MKVSVVETTFGLPRGFKVSQYDSLKEVITACEGEESTVVNIINKALRQRPVNIGWHSLSTYIVNNLRFPKDKGESDVKHCVRFAEKAVAREITPPGLALADSTNPEDSNKEVWEFLQKQADTVTGLKVNANPPDARLTVSPLRKYENLPEYARKGAETIITNGTQAKWSRTFKVEGIDVGDFTAKDDPEGNKLRLAVAIQIHHKKTEKSFA